MVSLTMNQQNLGPGGPSDNADNHATNDKILVMILLIMLYHDNTDSTSFLGNTDDDM